jgi:hypothetical protein
MRAERVAVFYSRGPHFARAIRAVQRDFPETEVLALMPPSAAATDHASIPEGIATVAAPQGAFAVLRFLRAEKFDGLVVMFPSPRLRLLAALSKARQRWVCGPDGRVLHLEESASAVLRERILSRISGTLLFLRLWFAVRGKRVKK